MLDPELMEQFQLLFGAIEQTKTDLRTEMREMEMRLHTEIQESETRTKVYIENEVVGELHSLFDGYRLTHEKQWEMDKETERLKRKVEDLQTRLEVLESKVAGS